MLKSLTIEGYRGFGEKQTVNFSLPIGENGSGLTIIVGANNSGKTSISECIRSFNFNRHSSLSFSEEKRNKITDEKVSIEICDHNDDQLKIYTDSRGGSEVSIYKNGRILEKGINGYQGLPHFFVVPARRQIYNDFGKSEDTSRESFLINSFAGTRNETLRAFEQRLFKIWTNTAKFNQIIEKILGEPLVWQIEQNKNGQYYLRVCYNNASHAIDGTGDGIWSAFIISDALYDSEPNTTIVIDEPELSLHPSVQKNMAELFFEYSKDRQIIVSTHSPYFINWDAIENGATIVRTVTTDTHNVAIHQLSKDTATSLLRFRRNLRNPHILGTDSKELFFLRDNIILVEGQDDVIMFQKMVEQLGRKQEGHFFGWGAGGADNYASLLRSFYELGYSKVICILDNNKKESIAELSKEFPSYRFLVIDTDDVRDKEPQREKPEVKGYMTTSGALKPDYISAATVLFDNICFYFKSALITKGSFDEIAKSHNPHRPLPRNWPRHRRGVFRRGLVGGGHRHGTIRRSV